MDPDLALTICFVFEVFVFALIGAIYVAHEARVERPQAAPASRRDNHDRSAHGR